MLRAATTRLAVVIACALIALAGAGLVLAAPLGTAFTYQGQLRQAGVPVNGTCDFQFSLFDAVAAGTQIGATQAATGVALVDGRFTVQLDFGAAAFTGEARWLQIATRCPAGTGGFTPLDPRQPLTPSPYALFSTAATSFTGNLAGDVTGTQGATIVARLQGRNVVNTAPTDGQVLKFNAAQNRWEPSAEVNATNYLNVYSVNGQSIAAAPTALELSTLGQNNGWTVSGGTPTTLSPQASGRYLIQYEVPAISSSGLSQVVGFRVTNNGAPIAGSQRAFLNPAFETAFASGSFIAALTAGDAVQLEGIAQTANFFISGPVAFAGDIGISASVTITRIQ